MKSKKGMELSINIIVMLILGLVIFGLGMGLFAKIAGSSEDQVGELENKIKTGIASLECDGEDWICVPKISINNGKSQSFLLYIANRGDEVGSFSVNVPTTLTKNDCGSIDLVGYPGDIQVRAKESAQVPFIVTANKVTKFPCSFIGTISLDARVGTASPFEEKATIIVAVE